jgi:hypothetical protein
MVEDEQEFRVFTLGEARSLIPTLRRLLARMAKARARLLDLRVEIDLAREQARYGGGSPAGPLYLKYMLAFTEAIQEIQEIGVHVKDFRSPTKTKSAGGTKPMPASPGDGCSQRSSSRLRPPSLHRDTYPTANPAEALMTWRVKSVYVSH